MCYILNICFISYHVVSIIITMNVHVSKWVDINLTKTAHQIKSRDTHATTHKQTRSATTIDI